MLTRVRFLFNAISGNGSHGGKHEKDAVINGKKQEKGPIIDGKNENNTSSESQKQEETIIEENRQENEASNGGDKGEKEALVDCKKRDNEGITPSRSLRRGFSDSFTSHDIEILGMEEQKEEEKVEVEEDEEKNLHVSCPTADADDSPRSMESETAFSNASTSDSEGQSNVGPGVHWHGFIKLLKKPGPKVQTFPPLNNVPKLTRRKSQRLRHGMVPTFTTSFDADLSYFKSSWKNFALWELLVATDNFSRENLIGEGGYAEVYKGQLPDGKFVAIKRLTRGSPEEMTMDFLSELGIIVHVDHPNIAKLIGYGVEGGMHLVLQLSPHGSLASILYGPKEQLDWGMRHKIAVGTAEGIFYLHEGCQRRIIHKDIKASNILLSEEFDAQISDFGLSKWLPDQWTHHTVSKVEGTFGYLPPEFFMHGIVDEKTDVYAYGVLLLELITGRQALDSSQHSLVMWAKPLIENNKNNELVDPTLGDAFDSEQLNQLVLTASMCIHQFSVNRPQMREIVQFFKGEGELEIVEQQKPILQRTYSEELLDADEYNSTKYLNDIHRHMEMVLSPDVSENLTPDCEEQAEASENITQHCDEEELKEVSEIITSECDEQSEVSKNSTLDCEEQTEVSNDTIPDCLEEAKASENGNLDHEELSNISETAEHPRKSSPLM